MRLVHWLFLLSMAFFISGVGLVIASARAVRRAPSAASSTAALTPVASVRQIMQGIVGPAAMVVYESVGTTMSASGTETWAPKTPEEWEKVGNSAAALVESANLIMLGNRAVDRGDWIAMSRAMLEGGRLALKATERKDADALFASGEPINASCDNCHEKYKRQ
jgi:hypothetical protein